MNIADKPISMIAHEKNSTNNLNIQENQEETEETEEQDEDDEEDMSTWSIEAIQPCKCVVPPIAPKRIKMIRVPQKKFQNIKNMKIEEKSKRFEETNREWYNGFGDVPASSLLTCGDQDIVSINFYYFKLQTIN